MNLLNPAPSLLVTVVVPTFKRPELLARCIEALKKQDFDRSACEIIIADDAADFSLEEQVEAWNCNPDGTVAKPRIRYIAVRGLHGPAAARNRGWQAASS